LGNSQTPWRDITFRIEKTADGVTLTYIGENNDESTVGPMTIEDTTAPFLTFDSLEITGAGGNGMNFRLDDVVITTNVPEPGVALLGCVGLLGLLHRRRS